MSKPDKPLFSQHEHALDKTYGVCPECGSELSIKKGKSGTFIGCDNYPNCHYTRAVVEHEKVDDKLLQGSECPECHCELAVKQGRYGMFIGCSNYPDCRYIAHEDSIENEENLVDCPQCKKGKLHAKTSRYGKIFYSCDQYPKCKCAVNYEPVSGSCEKCQYPLLLKRQMAAGQKLQCAAKKCSHFQAS